MNAFRALSESTRGAKHDIALELNYRPTQSLNSRTVLRSYKSAGIKPANFETCGAQGLLGGSPAPLITPFLAAAVLGWYRG